MLAIPSNPVGWCQSFRTIVEERYDTYPAKLVQPALSFINRLDPALYELESLLQSIPEGLKPRIKLDNAYGNN